MGGLRAKFARRPTKQPPSVPSSIPTTSDRSVCASMPSSLDMSEHGPSHSSTSVVRRLPPLPRPTKMAKLHTPARPLTRRGVHTESRLVVAGNMPTDLSLQKSRHGRRNVSRDAGQDGDRDSLGISFPDALNILSPVGLSVTLPAPIPRQNEWHGPREIPEPTLSEYSASQPNWEVVNESPIIKTGDEATRPGRPLSRHRPFGPRIVDDSLSARCLGLAWPWQAETRTRRPDLDPWLPWTTRTRKTGDREESSRFLGNLR
jgi:hypothetical protein